MLFIFGLISPLCASSADIHVHKHAYIHTYIYKQITSKSLTVDATDVATESASESAMLFLRAAHTATTAEAVQCGKETEMAKK